MKERCKDCTLTLGTAFNRSKVKYVLYNESLAKSENPAEKICFSFIFSPRWHRGCFRNCQSRSPQGWKSFMTLTWRCLGTSLTRLFEIVSFSCEIFRFLWYLRYLIFLWYLWYRPKSGNSQCFFVETTIFWILCILSYIIYRIYVILYTVYIVNILHSIF